MSLIRFKCAGRRIERALDFDNVVLVEALHLDDGAGRIWSLASQIRLTLLTIGRKPNMPVT
jgi:hypothetical protein